VGCNLDGNVDWNTAHVWADAAHAFRPWGPPDKPGESDAKIPLTADGYPLRDAAAVSYLANYPNGTYHLTYIGSGEVILGGMCQMANVKNLPGGRHTADVLLRHDNPDGYTGGNITLLVRKQSATDPARDIHLWSPGYGPGEKHWGETFQEDFVRRVRPFASVRYMDWAMTNNSPVVEWTDRTPPTAMIQLTRGIAWEYIVELANTVHRDAWVNVPDQASDEYVKQLATFLRDKLDPALKVRVEYSNEVWNAGFQQFGRTFERSKRDPRVTAKDDFGRIAQEYGLRSADCIAIFQSVFGEKAAGERVIGVLGGQTSNTYFADTALAAVKGKLGDPKKYFRELAIAPYVGNDLPKEAPAGGWTVDTLFPECERFTRTTLSLWLRQTRAVAEKYGLTMAAYEGGQHLTGNTTLPEPLKIAANHDRRMYGLYHSIADVWRENGGGMFQQFSHISGGWGMLDGVRDPGSYKWDAVMDELLPKGDATLDGRVTWEDFLVLKQHFGKREAWWEQGDFNGDNVVDEKDLELMLPNLKGLTAEQQKVVEGLRHH
jgi:hypothetical protein